MKAKKLIRIASILFSISFAGCTSPYWIIQGCVKDDFTLKLVDQNVELAPDKFFSINDLKLKENNYNDVREPKPFSYRDHGITSYKFSLMHAGKTYYGRISFNNLPTSGSTSAVSSFYKITIPQEYFDKAKDGQQSVVYEYWSDAAHNSSYATWIVWLSDIPLE